jgi:hypothetical protein
MVAGIYYDLPFLWRHGMMTEAGGLDLYEYANFAYAHFCPPGYFPFTAFLKDPVTCTILFSHHACGLAICLPLCIYYSDDYEF